MDQSIVVFLTSLVGVPLTIVYAHSQNGHTFYQFFNPRVDQLGGVLTLFMLLFPNIGCHYFWPGLIIALPKNTLPSSN
jgi:hypothetical protein